MKRYIASAIARYLFVFLAAGALVYAILSLAPGEPAQVILGKPAIYLYPQEETEVLVNVALSQGRFTATEPELGDGPARRNADRRDGANLALSVLGGQLFRFLRFLPGFCGPRPADGGIFDPILGQTGAERPGNRGFYGILAAPAGGKPL